MYNIENTFKRILHYIHSQLGSEVKGYTFIKDITKDKPTWDLTIYTYREDIELITDIILEQLSKYNMIWILDSLNWTYSEDFSKIKVA